MAGVRALTAMAGAFYRNIANRQPLACLLVGVLALGIRAALLPWLPAPLPRITDEFSYLLASDTYASGRITNPAHPLWQHFESIHILQQPTYGSKYPPLQGLVLAFGQHIFHQPWIGVWLSVGLMCSVMCWMLQGWMAPPWALLGALLVVLRLGVTSYWMNSYWGGAVAATGGALVLGALPRIARERRIGAAVIFGLGQVILMNSRPFEGFAVACAGCLALLWWLRKERATVREVALRVLAPVAAIVFLGAVGMAYQNYRVTGHALELPYMAHDRQYAALPIFIWAQPRIGLVYRHESIRAYWMKYQTGLYQQAAEHRAAVSLLNFLASYVVWFGWLPLAAMALLCPFALRTREEKLTVALLVFSLAPVLSLYAFLPHYLAPAACLAFLRLTQALERLHGWRAAGRPVGFVSVALIVFSMALPVPGEAVRSFPPRPDLARFAQERDSISQSLEHQPGNHLIFVRYSPNHDPNAEWVYNRADIDHSRIVWAHPLGAQEDASLVRYYSGRRVWLLDADAIPPKLTCAGSP